MSTDDSPTNPTEEPEVSIEEPERPSGISDEKWDAFMTKFDQFAERIEKGLSAKRPATPKSTQTITTPSKKPAPPAEEKTEPPAAKKKSKGYWG